MNDNKQNKIHRISLEKLHAHPDNPNSMSKETFAKLVRNIERTGRYEPIVIRQKDTSWQIINGHHRVKALRQLGYKTADCLVWDVDDHEAGILLATLNRLSGSDTLDKKLALLKRLNERMQSRQLAKLLPQTAKQIERLTSLKLPSAPAEIEAGSFLNAVTFFVNNDQYKIIRQALSLAEAGKSKQTKAQRNAAALTRIAEEYIKYDGRVTKDEGRESCK
jgi:ParB-like chromosome segregation protein Spo0J